MDTVQTYTSCLRNDTAPGGGLEALNSCDSLSTSFSQPWPTAEEYLQAVLDQYAKRGAIVSIVLDGYDVYRESELLCTKFRKQIISSGAKVVFRPDSGDPLQVIPRILAMQELAFGADRSQFGVSKTRYDHDKGDTLFNLGSRQAA
jgi:hypothetical protein